MTTFDTTYGRRILIALLLALIALCATGAGAPAYADERDSELLQSLPLSGLSEKEQERIRNAAWKLVRIHRTIGDAGTGETGQYIENVEALARFLKRGAVEEMRRLVTEAEIITPQVDRRWINEAFASTRHHETDAAPAIANIARLKEQVGLFKRLGEIVRQLQAIPTQQKRIEQATERGYRNLIRLVEEAEQTYSSIDYAPAQNELQWIRDDINTRFVSEIRPAHARQNSLQNLSRAVRQQLGTDRAEQFLQLFREYSSKLNAIVRYLERRDRETD
ncbi:MAG: hypothetical protein HKN20_18465 [Gemmatimonadetes bacterium]|nr:hypothetical protein [Gemmatimonadota bacterium]